MEATAPHALFPDRTAGQILAAWMRGTWCLFRLAPLAIFALSVFPIAVEAALQVVPHAGIVLSKLLTPLASAWVLVMLDKKARTGSFTPLQAARLWWARLPRIVLASVLLAGVFAFQLLAAAVLGGGEQALALALGNMDELTLSRVQLAAMLASGMLPGSLLMFVGPRVVLDGLGVWPAIGESLQLVGHYWRPVAVFAVASALLVASLLWMPLVLLVFLPFATCAGYAVYRDVFDRAASEAA